MTFVNGVSKASNDLCKRSIEERDKLPSDGNFTFENGYISWVTAIFVDIRDSTTLFSKNDEYTAKMVRAFTSEVIEILRSDENIREIGIRGDCVYAIYTTSKQSDILDCADKTFDVNTFINMFNKIIENRGGKGLKVGIGMATDKELVIKAGRKSVGINNKVWIGKAVTIASKLSSYGDKHYLPRLMYSKSSYINFIEGLEERNRNANSWFKYIDDFNAYSADIVKVDFNNWINNGFS